MKKITPFVLLLLLSLSKTYAQQNMDSIFVKLNIQPITTGLLFDKAIHLSNMQNYKGTNNDTISYDLYEQFYSELYQSQVALKMRTNDDSLLNRVRELTAYNFNPLLILNFDYNIIRYQCIYKPSIRYTSQSNC